MLKDFVNQCEPLPNNSKLLVLGGGFSGQHIAALGRKLGNHVICSRRKIDSSGADCVFDSAIQKLPSDDELSAVTHVLSCIPPDSNGKDPVLQSLKNQLKKMPLKWVGYLSTTGVYGDCEGNWVTESDPPKPQLRRSQIRLECEKAWQRSGLPIQILRLPGIYGPGRSAIDTIKAGRTKLVDKPGQVFSRIHIDDIAGATFHLIHLANKGKRPKIVNLADNLPSSNIEVMLFAASLMKASLPPIEPFQIAAKKMSPMALSFWQENRRVSNQMLCNELHYSLVHPNYQAGLRDCFKQAK